MASLFRKATYKELSNIYLNGEILDVGGSRKADYHGLFKGDYSIISSDVSGDCDINFDAEKDQWPFANDKFDAVLMINLLEHLFDYNFALSQAGRVLKNNGKIIVVVPFFINLHPSPNDYFRFTKQALQRIFNNLMFRDIEIKEISGGFFAVHYYLWQRFIPSFFDIIFMPLVRLFDNLLAGASKLIKGRYNKNEYPLGYFVKARK